MALCPPHHLAVMTLESIFIGLHFLYGFILFGYAERDWSKEEGLKGYKVIKIYTLILQNKYGIIYHRYMLINIFK